MKCFWLVTLLSVLADAAVKGLSAAFLQGRVPIGRLLELRLTHNSGMALGLFAGQVWVNLLLPPVAVLLGAMLMRRYRQTRFTAVRCGLVLGGFLGNYGQRIAMGYVLDMLYFPWMPLFVCNVADICICAGVLGLVVSLLFRPQDWQERTKEG